MDVAYERCAGLDVHQKSVVACVRVVAEGRVSHEVRTFSTMTSELLALADWLAACGCTHVAMESTGVFWKPVWHVLEGSFTLVLANAMHIRNIPGRKSDVNDATWIADLLAHGLIRSSFVPPAPVQELRDLTRTRKQLMREVARHTQRLQRILEDANVKLTSVVSDILDIARGASPPAFGVPAAKLRAYKRARLGQHQGAYYVRLSVFDRPGAMAKIAGRMGEREVSLESIVQRRPRGAQPGIDARPTPGAPTSVILITHETTEAAIRAVLDAIHKDGQVSEKPQMIRIEPL